MSVAQCNYSVCIFTNIYNACFVTHNYNTHTLTYIYYCNFTMIYVYLF